MTTNMKFDDILLLIGDFGAYQIFLLTMICLSAVPSSMNSLSGVFLIAEVDHWCAVEEWADGVNDCYDLLESSNEEYLQCIHQYRKSAVPTFLDDGEMVYAECEKYDATYPDQWSEDYLASNFTNDTTSCDDGWVYDRAQYASTVVTDFDLVCDKKALVETSQSLFYFGYLLGTIMYTIAADFIGRKYTLLISITFSVLLTLATAFSTSLVMFGILRVFNGAFDQCMYTAAFVIGTEFLGPSRRVYAGVLISVMYAFGYMTLGLLAYLIRDWRTLQIVIACSISPCLLLIVILPESARWLISKKKIEPAVELIKKVAERNKTAEKLPPNLQEMLTEESKGSTEDENATFIDLIRTPGLRFTTLNMMFNWSINTLVYYGLSFNSVELGSNEYMTFSLSGLVEIPAYLICIPLIGSSLGRKWSTCLLEVIGGISCIITAFLANGVVKTTVAMVGKFCISSSFAIIYIYSAEIFPTVARSAGLGLCSTAGQIGNILAPLILALKDNFDFLPLLIYGIAAVGGGLLVVFLPETRGNALPENLGEYHGRTNPAFQSNTDGFNITIRQPKEPTAGGSERNGDVDESHL